MRSMMEKKVLYCSIISSLSPSSHSSLGLISHKNELCIYYIQARNVPLSQATVFPFFSYSSYLKHETNKIRAVLTNCSPSPSVSFAFPWCSYPPKAPSSSRSFVIEFQVVYFFFVDRNFSFHFIPVQYSMPSFLIVHARRYDMKFACYSYK